MTIQEIQEIIDNQEFKRLNGDDTSFWLGFDVYTLTKLTFTSELFKWMFEKNNYRHWKQYVGSPLDVFRKMTDGYYYTPTLEDMKHFIDFLQQVLESSYIGSYRLNIMEEFPAGTYEHIIKYINTNSNIKFQRIQPTDRDIKELSEESKKLLGQYLLNKGRIRKMYSNIRNMFTNIGYDKVIEMVGKEKFKEFIEWTSYEQDTHFRQFQLIKDAMTPEEIFQWIDELASKNMHILLQYVPKYFNTRVEISDDIIEKLITYNNDSTISVTSQSVRHFTKDQFKRLNRTYAYLITTTKDGTLGDYVDMADEETQRRESYSLINSRRFTEEEILKYPTCFVPEHMNDDSGLYFTKDTLKVLNKTHGKRQRYYEEDQTLVRLMLSNMRHSPANGFNNEYFFYLIEKTKASNEDILKSLDVTRNKKDNPLSAYAILIDLFKEE